jgi:hypothetical protein
LEESDEEENKGGCPMKGVSKRKRSPGLFIPETVIPIPYLSPFHQFLK